MNREEFIIFWAEFVKKHSDKEWSKQQKILIDSQISSAREFYRKNPKIMKKIIEKFRNRKNPKTKL